MMKEYCEKKLRRCYNFLGGSNIMSNKIVLQENIDSIHEKINAHFKQLPEKVEI